MNKKVLSAFAVMNSVVLAITLLWLASIPTPSMEVGDLTVKGHLGVGGAPPVPCRTLNIDETIIDPEGGLSYRISGMFIPHARATTRDNNKTIIGVVGEAVLDKLNTKDWTRTIPLRGVQGQVTGMAGAEGTVTKSVSVMAVLDWEGGTIRDWRGVYVLPYTVSPGEVEDCYGVYIEDVKDGSNLNYAIYAVGGKNYLGGEVTCNSTLDMPNIPTSDPYVAGRVWSNGGVLTISDGG